ncbi:MAG: J domain-containing protein [Actinomycetota bacterium]|jgi:curved DNA-binding protein CbpA
MKPWEVLGVPQRATRAEITTAYRTLAYIFHPDRFVDAPDPVKDEAQRRMAQLNKAYDLAKRGRKDEVTYNIVADERAAAERMARARAQPAWQDVVRERARAEAKAKQEREARERAMVNGQARSRPKPKVRNGPSIMAGAGEAVHTGKIFCRSCKSIQWLPAEWREALTTTDFYCSVCDKIILSR